ncbi:dUTP diphosphatase [Bifidobacterium aemilianum]|uniref:Deoxyuridine 5'-triphosphate nucleotidohydrolase n=1 Tax=Bifidobacterium aemilianum TaxID=2493120 RepID=A0A366KAK2_9BIFI|nr:dUTP diphosphatase [Bifidobacterium aemilianum]RBP98178.1 dUTP diphosphatase [Bifidobacterium aemilianum]
MAMDPSYNEPETVEVLVRSLVDGQEPELIYAHAGDAGADLRTTEDVVLKPFQRALVPTGIAMALPAGYVALIHPRSGLAAKQGVTVLNAPGTIDAGYRGEIKVPLINLDPEHTAVFHPGDRIAQLVIQRYVQAQFIKAQELPGSDRSERGFGSTGVSSAHSGASGVSAKAE